MSEHLKILGFDVRTDATMPSDEIAVLYKCPVCDGTGLVSRPPGMSGEIDTWWDTQTGPYACRSCNGLGVVGAKP